MSATGRPVAGVIGLTAPVSPIEPISSTGTDQEPSPGDLLVIFDCDGVLVDTERLRQEVDMLLITELGWPVTLPEMYVEHLGLSTADFIANIERHVGHPVPPGWEQLRTGVHRELMERELTAVPGVAAAIAELADHRIRSCVGSSGTHEAIRYSLELTGLWPHFEGRIFSALDVERGKPAPDLFLHAAQRMGSPPTRCIVIEDSPAGVAAARAAAMLVIGYAGFTPSELLAMADAVIDDMGLLVPTIRALTAD